jgi:hypothetical protein
MKTVVLGFCLALWAGVANAVGLYPDGHFDYVAKISDRASLDSFVESNLAADKAVFVRFIASEG